MIGEITQAKAARSFGRQGKLRFRIRELRLPGGFTQPVEGTLAGIDSTKKENLKIDSEGGVQQKQSQAHVIVPMALNFLAARAFDTDENQALNRAVASNGFGIHRPACRNSGRLTRCGSRYWVLCGCPFGLRPLAGAWT